MAGAQNKPRTFLITDSQIKEESFLEDIDSLLNSGEVPNLYTMDEKAEIVEVCTAQWPYSGQIARLFLPFFISQHFTNILYST